MATLNSFYKYRCYAYNDNANVQMFSMSASDVPTDSSLEQSGQWKHQQVEQQIEFFFQTGD